MGGVLGLNPVLAEKANASDPESWVPSRTSTKSSTPTIKKFDELTIESQYTGGKKILVLCTTKKFLQMQNGKYFNTGHQASETFVPIYHMGKCGFTFEFATPDGSPVAIEEWTFPMAVGYEDKLREVQSQLQDQLSAPKKMTDILPGGIVNLEPYAAVFLPGGHGPVIEQHKIESLGKILRAAHEISLPTISLCHGPSALRAAAVGGEFPYKDYKICVFPDKTDKMTPKFGYLPGYMKEEDFVEAELKKLGMLVQNKEMDDSTCIDRELVTGASQMASQSLAFAACRFLADKYEFAIKP